MSTEAIFSALVAAPVLLLILMLGPLGFALYLAVLGAYQVAGKPLPAAQARV